MLRENKGVASVDLLFATLIVVIVIGSLVSMIGSETEKTKTAELGRARMVGERIATTINTVYINGRGYSANITMPTDIDMTVRVTDNGYLRVSYGLNTMDIRLVPRSNIQAVTMTRGEIFQVSNVNGTLQFTRL